MGKYHVEVEVLEADANGQRAARWRVMEGKGQRKVGAVPNDPKGVHATHQGRLVASAMEAAEGNVVDPESISIELAEVPVGGIGIDQTQPPRRLTAAQLLDGAPKSGWQPFHIAKLRWIEEGPAAAIGAHESSREEIAADIGRGATYVVISDDQRRVTVTVKPSRHDLNYLHAVPDGSARDLILDLPTYP